MTALYDNFKWRETAPRVWQRDPDEAERFYATLIKQYEASGRMHFAITGHVSLVMDVPDTESVEAVSKRFDDSLRVAWLRLRHDIPAIASRVNYDSAVGKWTKTYEAVPDHSSRNAWLRRTFQTISTGQTGAEWANADPPAPGEATMFVITPPVARSQSGTFPLRRDLVLRSPHDIIDGIGTLQLFDQYIAHVTKAFTGIPATHSTLLDGSETVRLSPPYRVAARVPPNPGFQSAGQSGTATTEQQPQQPKHDDEVEDIGIPYRRGPTLPGKHQRVARTIPADRTSQFLAAVKRANATPTHAFHAAIAMSVRNVHAEQHHRSQDADDKEERAVVRYTNYILRNERTKCAPPYNTPAHCAAVYHSLSPGRLTVDMPLLPRGDQNAEFARILEHMRDYYHAVRDDPTHYARAPAIWAAATPDIDISATPVPVPPPNPRPSVSISSMGVIDRIIVPARGPVRVYDPWVTGEELGTGLGLFLGTFRGELCLSAAYNDAWHDRDEVEGFLKRCEEVVFRWVRGAV